MRAIYISDDNKLFDDEIECQRHEWILNHPHLKDIECYDDKGNLFTGTDLINDDAYNYCVKIIVPTEDCVKELHDVVEYTGFIYWNYITEPGTWVYKEEKNKDKWKGLEGKFVKES